MAASSFAHACRSFLRAGGPNVSFTRDYSKRGLRRRPLNVIDPVSGERTPVTPRGRLALQIKTDREGNLKNESRTTPKPAAASRSTTANVKNEAARNSGESKKFEARQKIDANQRREPRNWTANPAPSSSSSSSSRRETRNDEKFQRHVEPPPKNNRASSFRKRNEYQHDSGSDNGRDFIPERINFKRLEPKDKRMGKLMVLLKSRKSREKQAKVILEGSRLIRDAIQAGAKAHSFFFSHVRNLRDIPVLETEADLFKVAHRDINTWSDLVTSQGVIGVFERPQPDTLRLKGDWALPLTLICDNVRESGNLGTILRSAIAAGCKRVLVSKGCVDIWEPKVLRSAAGVHFRAPIYNNLTWQDIANHLGKSTPVHLAVSRPMTAGGLDTGTESDDDTTDGDSDMDDCETETETVHETVDEVHGDPESDGETFDPEGQQMEVKAHYAVDWRRDSALVIGGETEGLSQGALQLCRQTGGWGVHVPTRADVNSLNNSMAASVILFEASRQHQGQ